MTSFTKSIDTLCVYKNLDGKENVVYGVNWTMTAEDSGIVCSYGAFTNVPLLGNNFKPFDSLDEQTILSWVETFTPDYQMKNIVRTLEADIEVKKQNAVVIPPWVPPPPPPPEPVEEPPVEQPVEEQPTSGQ